MLLRRPYLYTMLLTGVSFLLVLFTLNFHPAFVRPSHAQLPVQEITTQAAQLVVTPEKQVRRPDWCVGCITRPIPRPQNDKYVMLPVWYTSYDIALIANVVLHECPYCGDRQQDLTAMCVVNRVFAPNWPDHSVYEVIVHPNQYSVAYTINLPDPNDQDVAVQRAFRAAIRAVTGQIDCPLNVVYQANFPQGNGVYEAIHFQSQWFESWTYFCYG